MTNDDFIGSQGEFVELSWGKMAAVKCGTLFALFDATPGERLWWTVAKLQLSALNVNPGEQLCHVLLRGAICRRSFH